MNPNTKWSGWEESHDAPGYRQKTIHHDNCTVVIRRPMLEPKEYAARMKLIHKAAADLMKNVKGCQT